MSPLIPTSTAAVPASHRVNSPVDGAAARERDSGTSRPPGDAKRPPSTKVPLASPAPRLEFPSHLRLLCLAHAEPDRSRLVLALQKAGGLEPAFHWVDSCSEAAHSLGERGADCLLILCEEGTPIDLRGAVQFLTTWRELGHDIAVLMLLGRVDDVWVSRAADLDAELLISPLGWNSPVLVSALHRAINRRDTARQLRHLRSRHEQRIARDRDEAERILRQQRQWIASLDRDRDEAKPPLRLDHDSAPDTDQSPRGSPLASQPPENREGTLPTDRHPRSSREELVPLHQDLLRAQVILGAESTSNQLTAFSDRLAAASVTPRQLLELHLSSVEQLVRGMGNNSSRHILARAELLLLELLIQLGECYQRRVGPIVDGTAKP